MQLPVFVTTMPTWMKVAAVVGATAFGGKALYAKLAAPALVLPDPAPSWVLRIQLKKQGQVPLVPCTATVISQKLLLTAGHCVENLDTTTGTKNVTVSWVNPLGATLGASLFSVAAKAFVHPTADLALIHLGTAVAPPLAGKAVLQMNEPGLAAPFKIFGFGLSASDSSPNCTNDTIKKERTMFADTPADPLTADAGSGSNWPCDGDSGAPWVTWIPGPNIFAPQIPTQFGAHMGKTAAPTGGPAPAGTTFHAAPLPSDIKTWIVQKASMAGSTVSCDTTTPSFSCAP